MYNKIMKLVVVFICIFISIGTTVYSQGYTLNDLIEEGKELDGQNIVIKGEAIGEVLNRNIYSWVNINDKTNAMGIYMKTSDSEKITQYGGYNKIGDTIEVRGIFNRACKEHGGDMDVHAKEVIVVDKGKVLKDSIPKYKVILSIVLTTLTCIISIILYKNLKKK